MWYVIEGRDAPGSLDRRRSERAGHLARIELLRDQGRVLLAGPCPSIDAADPGPAGYSGSLVVAEFESLQAAREWAEADPYVPAGVWSEVEVRPFERVLP